VCPRTVNLMKLARSRWSRRAHHLFHRSFRSSVHELVLVSHRLRATGATTLPTELWHHVLTFLARRDWPAL